MLVLTRKLGEQIQIDGCIEVTVLGVDGHRVRLGIKAPSDVTIRRRELVFDLPDASGDEQAACERELCAMI
jgi:carbon storage regulator